MSNLVSIIVATFNSAATVGDTLKSILKQEYKNVEIIIQDGQSKDDTLEIVKSFRDSRIKVFSERDEGIYDAMNKGLARASGDIIGILNSDDVYADEDVLQTIADEFSSNSEISVTYGNLEYVDLTLTKVLRYWKSQIFSKNLFWIAWQPPHPTVYLRRSVYDSLGNFDLKFKIAADFDMMFRVFFKSDFKSSYIDKTMVKMRIGGESNRSLKNRMILLKEYQAIYAKHGHRLVGPFTIIGRLLSRITQFKFGRNG